jgi:hypothetical protein
VAFVKQLPPPRRQQFTSQVAQAVWAAVTQLDVGSQHELLRELRDLLEVANRPGRGTVDDGVKRAISALRDAERHLGRSPSVKDYRRLRAEHLEWEWPPDTSVRVWLGSGRWNDALQRARLDAVPDGDDMIIEYGPGFMVEEAINALKECAEDLGCLPTLSMYEGWAHRLDVRQRPGRRPLSQAAFERLFGGFSAALRAANLADDNSVHIATDGAIRSKKRRFTEDELLAGLVEVAERLGHLPSTVEYMHERQTIITDSQKEGALRTIPGHQVIQRRFVSWEDALQQTLRRISNPTFPGYVGRVERRRMSEAFLLENLRQALDAVDGPLTLDRYEAWRKQQMRNDSARVPSGNTYYHRFGTFRGTVERVRRSAST